MYQDRGNTVKKGQCYGATELVGSFLLLIRYDGRMWAGEGLIAFLFSPGFLFKMGLRRWSVVNGVLLGEGVGEARRQGAFFQFFLMCLCLGSGMFDMERRRKKKEAVECRGNGLEGRV